MDRQDLLPRWGPEGQWVRQRRQDLAGRRDRQYPQVPGDRWGPLLLPDPGDQQDLTHPPGLADRPVLWRRGCPEDLPGLSDPPVLVGQPALGFRLCNSSSAASLCSRIPSVGGVCRNCHQIAARNLCRQSHCICSMGSLLISYCSPSYVHSPAFDTFLPVRACYPFPDSIISYYAVSPSCVQNTEPLLFSIFMVSCN